MRALVTAALGLPLAVAVAALGACSAPSSAGAAGGADAAGDTAADDANGTDAGSTGPGDAGEDALATMEAGGDVATLDDGDGGDGSAECFVSSVGVTGQCLSTSDCAALGDHTSSAGYCPGPASIECCTLAPNVADNPPVPTGWQLMQQVDVTSDMTTWAVAILDHPATYPMFSTTMMTFGTLTVLARVEWHLPDGNNETVHRGVTLYQPA